MMLVEHHSPQATLTARNNDNFISYLDWLVDRKLSWCLSHPHTFGCVVYWSECEVWLYFVSTSVAADYYWAVMTVATNHLKPCHVSRVTRQVWSLVGIIIIISVTAVYTFTTALLLQTPIICIITWRKVMYHLLPINLRVHLIGWTPSNTTQI